MVTFSITKTADAFTRIFSSHLELNKLEIKNGQQINTFLTEGPKLKKIW